MPAKSKAQQKLMGMALAYKRGELTDDEASDEVKRLANQMSEEELEDYADTDRKGLPKKKSESSEFMKNFGHLIETDGGQGYATASSTPGMGPVSSPGSGSFHSQEKGSGDPLGKPPGARRRGKRGDPPSRSNKTFDDFVKSKGEDYRDRH